MSVASGWPGLIEAYREHLPVTDSTPVVTLLEPEGGWSAVLRVPAHHSEDAWCARLLEEDGVLVQPGYFFDFPGEAFLVLSLLAPPDAFAAGVTGELPALTNAELRVLRFLPSHLTFREIGDRLHVSANTVKTQALSAYRKLDVGSRSEAVARGRAVGLLDG